MDCSFNQSFWYSCLENPTDRGAQQAAVHGVTEGRARLSDFTLTFHFPALEKEMATHSSVLAWRIPGTEEPGGLLSMGSHRVGHNWSDLAAAAAASSKITAASSRLSQVQRIWTQVRLQHCYKDTCLVGFKLVLFNYLECGKILEIKSHRTYHLDRLLLFYWKQAPCLHSLRTCLPKAFELLWELKISEFKLSTLRPQSVSKSAGRLLHTSWNSAVSLMVKSYLCYVLSCTSLTHLISKKHLKVLMNLLLQL